jgi:hypothetical protein
MKAEREGESERGMKKDDEGAPQAGNAHAATRSGLGPSRTLHGGAVWKTEITGWE